MLEPADFAARLKSFLVEHGHRRRADVDDAMFAVAADLVQTRIVVLSDAWDLLKFLLRRRIGLRSGSTRLPRPRTSRRTRRRSSMPRSRRWTACGDWTTAGIEEALKTALIDDLELKPRKAFAPVRVAVTGSHISPPLYESMELLGRERTLDRCARLGPSSASGARRSAIAPRSFRCAGASVEADLAL